MLAALALLVCAGLAHAQDAPIKIGAETWPGVTVKSEVAAQVMRAMGYDTQRKTLPTSIIMQGLASGEIDVTFGAWLPAQQFMIQPLLKKNKVVKLAVNLSGAIEGLAVPKYVWQAGVHSVSDLTQHGDRFDRTIYGIEAGAAMNEKIQSAIDSDYKGLGDWHLVASSAAAMLTQVGRATDSDNWIVFLGWKPHWMDIAYDLRYLRDRKGSEIARIESTVYTVVPAGWPEKHPDLARFLKRFKVEPRTQSQWIYDYSYKKQKPEEVAKRWLAGHPDVASGWLKGVKTRDGRAAIKALREALGKAAETGS